MPTHPDDSILFEIAVVSLVTVRIEELTERTRNTS